VGESVLDYRRLLARVREVADDVSTHVAVRERIDALGVTIHERAGTARFANAHTVVTESGLRLEADKDHHLYRRREPASDAPRLRVDLHP
jgi:hypothetical protein